MDRYQSVLTDGAQSAPKLLIYGVPQGSVLGPKMYIMYTKPLGDLLRSHGPDCHFYADDAQLYESNSISTTQDTIGCTEKCLVAAGIWLDDNMLRGHPKSRPAQSHSPSGGFLC